MIYKLLWSIISSAIKSSFSYGAQMVLIHTQKESIIKLWGRFGKVYLGMHSVKKLICPQIANSLFNGCKTNKRDRKSCGNNIQQNTLHTRTFCWSCHMRIILCNITFCLDQQPVSKQEAKEPSHLNERLGKMKTDGHGWPSEKGGKKYLLTEQHVEI